MSGNQTPAPVNTSPGFWLGLWQTVRLPVQVLLFGLVILALIRLVGFAGLPPLSGLDLSGLNGQATVLVVATLVFVVGLGFVVFLWWLVSRFFGLLKSGQLSEASLAAMRELPVGLPEGTVRAILALIVATVGLPLLLFTKVLGLPESSSGYLNGIIIGVFSFYFGSKVAGVPSSAVRQIADSDQRARTSEENAKASDQKAQAAEQLANASVSTAGDARRAASFTEQASGLLKHAQLASSLLKSIVPLLPPGTLPAKATEGLAKADTLLGLLTGVNKDTVSGSQIEQIAGLGGALLGGGGSGPAPLLTLLQKAAPMLGGLAIPGLGPVAAIGAILSIGVNLSSAAFTRWRARVLAVPLASAPVEFGAITPDSITAAIARSPLFAQAFANQQHPQLLASELLDILTRPDAADRLFAKYGPQSAAPAFASRETMLAALGELNQSLLAARLATDIPDNMPADIVAKLSKADQELRIAPAALASPADASRLLDAAAAASASSPPNESKAAFDALVMLAGFARAQKIDFPALLAELKQ